jgi:Co/Zn/Cd efflux system component
VAVIIITVMITATVTAGDAEGHDHDEAHRIATPSGMVALEVFEEGVPPRFRLRAEPGPALQAESVTIETVRPDGTRRLFPLVDQGGYLESREEIPEPHAFTAKVQMSGETYALVFEEHEHAHGAAARDNNMRAAIVHVMADAAVSVLVIVGLILARSFGWLWMDPLAGSWGLG